MMKPPILLLAVASVLANELTWFLLPASADVRLGCALAWPLLIFGVGMEVWRRRHPIKLTVTITQVDPSAMAPGEEQRRAAPWN